MSESTSFVSSRNRDCAGCRLISGSGLIGAGLYITYHARYFDKKIGKIIMLAIAGASIGLGAARIVNLPPFRDQFGQDRDEKSSLLKQ